jgi:hypothetical protein
MVAQAEMWEMFLVAFVHIDEFKYVKEVRT